MIIWSRGYSSRERTKEVYPRNVIALSELASIGPTAILSIMAFAQ
jgi:hypothetical protein